MQYAIDQFVMTHNDVFIVQGSNSLFTYQNVGNSEAVLQGSNDSTQWVDIYVLPSKKSLVVEHSYKYLRAMGNTFIMVNRGEGNNTNDSSTENTQPPVQGSGDYSFSVKDYNPLERVDKTLTRIEVADPTHLQSTGTTLKNYTMDYSLNTPLTLAVNSTTGVSYTDTGAFINEGDVSTPSQATWDAPFVAGQDYVLHFTCTSITTLILHAQDQDLQDLTNQLRIQYIPEQSLLSLESYSNQGVKTSHLLTMLEPALVFALEDQKLVLRYLSDLKSDHSLELPTAYAQNTLAFSKATQTNSVRLTQTDHYQPRLFLPHFTAVSGSRFEIEVVPNQQYFLCNSQGESMTDLYDTLSNNPEKLLSTFLHTGSELSILNADKQSPISQSLTGTAMLAFELQDDRTIVTLNDAPLTTLYAFPSQIAVCIASPPYLFTDFKINVSQAFSRITPLLPTDAKDGQIYKITQASTLFNKPLHVGDFIQLFKNKTDCIVTSVVDARNFKGTFNNLTQVTSTLLQPRAGDYILLGTDSKFPYYFDSVRGAWSPYNVEHYRGMYNDVSALPSLNIGDYAFVNQEGYITLHGYNSFGHKTQPLHISAENIIPTKNTKLYQDLYVEQYLRGVLDPQERASQRNLSELFSGATTFFVGEACIYSEDGQLKTTNLKNKTIISGTADVGNTNSNDPYVGLTGEDGSRIEWDLDLGLQPLNLQYIYWVDFEVGETRIDTPILEYGLKNVSTDAEYFIQQGFNETDKYCYERMSGNTSQAVQVSCGFIQKDMGIFVIGDSNHYSPLALTQAVYPYSVPKIFIEKQSGFVSIKKTKIKVFVTLSI